MADNTLTHRDKARLVASTDLRSDQGRNETLYRALKSMPEPQPEELDGRTRRAITAFVMETWASLAIAAANNNLNPASMTMGAMTEMLITGYELGRQLQKPLTAPAGDPIREGK
ncbi:hypothetical protein KKE60_05385 [Patescibacteria group bacterium]|nr:hypothetical protein [Patescibacteria group bacterium]